METTDSKPTRRRRTNDEILADMRSAKKNPPKRKRRTKAQIARDNEKARIAAEEAAAKARVTYKVVHFFDEVNAFGNLWKKGDTVHVHESTVYHKLAYDANGRFILNRSPQEQITQWGKVRYEVEEVDVNEFDPTNAR